MKILKPGLAAIPLILGLTAFAPLPCAAETVDYAKMKREIGQADYYVKEFEKEVALQHGGEKMVWRSKNDALRKVQALKEKYPDDPEVEALFQRTKTALMKSKGDYTEVHPEWVAYKKKEEELRKTVSEIGDREWDRFLSSHKADIIPAAPIPNPDSVSIADVRDKYVLLENVEYPSNQFYGLTGEYLWQGKPSLGYYFINISERNWLGPYEAVKRFRRTVDSSIGDTVRFTVLGKITEVVAENPDPAKKKIGVPHLGWVVMPVALKVPGHVSAFYKEAADSSGYYAGEDQIKQIKEGWYSIKSIPANVTPEKLMEIFMTAIKEKNFDLYMDCINPDRKVGPRAPDQVRYHWDLHQERFQKEYVHATFDKAEIKVIKGFDNSDETENFFLDDEQRAILNKTQGEVVKQAIVNSRAFNENGKQIGSPHPHVLIKKGNGRWYVEDYAARF